VVAGVPPGQHAGGLCRVAERGFEVDHRVEVAVVTDPGVDG
jgi:hypothetical protein